MFYHKGMREREPRYNPNPEEPIVEGGGITDHSAREEESFSKNEEGFEYEEKEDPEMMAVCKAEMLIKKDLDTENVPIEQWKAIGTARCEQIRDIIEKYGLDYNEAVKNWARPWVKMLPERPVETGKKYVRLEIFRKALALERERPGIIKRLYEEQGILNFDRYSWELLLNQYDTFDDQEKPYGVALLARYDHNDALSLRRDTWDELNWGLEGKYNLRIIECDDKTGIARQMIKLNKRYGKADFAIINAHGEQNEIHFGDPWDKTAQVTSSEISKPAIKKMAKFLKSEPVIVLASCLTGRFEGGIGRQISYNIGAKVIAPRIRPTSFQIYPKISGDKIDFDVTYNYDDNELHKATFLSGEKQ